MYVFYMILLGLTGTYNISQKNHEQKFSLHNTVWNELKVNGNLSSGNKVDTLAFGFEFDLNKKLNTSNELNFSIGTTHEKWDFRTEQNSSGINSLNNGKGPWEDVNTFFTSLTLTQKINNWSVFGGPSIDFSFEENGRFSKSNRIGGHLGFVYKKNKQLLFGGGVGFKHGLKKSVFNPIIILKYNICNDWFFQSKKFLELQSIEICKQSTKQVSAVGIGFKNKIFRLSKNHFADEFLNDGVGEYHSIPIYFRSDWFIDKNITLRTTVGTCFNEKLIVRNNNGHRLYSEKIKDSIVFSAQLNIKF